MFKSDFWHGTLLWFVKYNYNICNAKKMNCALMFIMSNHYGKKCLSNFLQLEPWSDMISDIMAHCYDLGNTIMKAINFCNGKEINSALLYIMSNDNGIKCLSSLL